MVAGAGTDIGGSADEFHFVYQPVSGDVDIRVRVASIENVNPGVKAGLMIRETLDDRARNAFVFASPDQSVAYQQRRRTNRSTSQSPAATLAPPQWLRLTRTGTAFNAYSSADGTSWTPVGSGTISMGANAYVGLAVTSGVADRTASASFDNLALGSAPTTALPAPWIAGDIGGPAIAGETTSSGGTFTVTGAGIDIWNTSDQFQFLYQPVTGDTEIVAYVADLDAAGPYSKAGVMIRADLTGPSANAYMRLAEGNGWRFNRRLVAGGTTIGSGPSSTPDTAPGWVRLVREGSLFSAYQSADGNNWTLIGSDTISMPSTVYVGLAVTSNAPTATATAAFSNVSVSAPTSTNKPPTVALSAPAGGASYTAPASVTLTATAGDVDGSVSKVDFYAGTQLVGSDTSSPYSVTWTSAAAGNYSLTAVATDNDGAQTKSQAVAVTINDAANKPPTVALSAPAAGTTYTAPAIISIAAGATDSDGSISKVDFYAGTQLVGSDTSSPYSATWTNVAAGSYSLTAVATDNDGAKTTSSAAAITVQGIAPAIPTTVLFTPGADYATNVTSCSVELHRASDSPTATPVARRNLGKPAIVSGTISVDISTLVDPLPAGSYYAVIIAVGPGGSTPSAPSAAFTK